MLLFLLACGPKLSEELKPNASINLNNCNKREHMIALGKGSTEDASIEDGQVKIAKKIQLSISYQSEKISKYVGKTRTFNGKVEKNADAIKTFKKYTKVSSNFDKANLMDVVKGPEKSKGEYRSLVCLNKSKTTQILNDELRPTLSTFQHLAEQAQQKYSVGDIASFSIKYHKAMDLRLKISSSLYVIYSISDHVSTLEAPFNESWNALEYTAETIRGDLNIGLHLSDDVLYTNKEGQKQAFPQPQIFVDAFRKGLENSAITVQTTKKCQPGLSHFISLKVEPICHIERSFRQLDCSVTYHPTLKNCKTNNKLELSISDTNLHEASSQGTGSYEELLRKIAKKEILSSLIQKELRNYFPIIVLED